MSDLKIINQKELQDWAKELFTEHNYKMIDVSDKQPTFRKALATGKIIVGKKTFDLIKDKKMVKAAQDDKPETRSRVFVLHF